MLSFSDRMVELFCEERPKGDNRSTYKPTKTTCRSYTAPFQRALHKTGAQEAGYLWSFVSFAVCAVKNQGKGDTRAQS